MPFELHAPEGRRARARAHAKTAWAAAAYGLTVLLAAPAAEAKTPGKTYCFVKKCHRVLTLKETDRLVGRDLQVTASFYDSCKRDRFNPCGLTSSGARFEPDQPDNAASPVLPDGTIVLAWSKATGTAAVLRINNAGPYWGNRTLDLSRAAAQKLGVKGVGPVQMRVLRAPTPAEARYVKNRRYEAVPGPIGTYADLEAAQSSLNTMIALGEPGLGALTPVTTQLAAATRGTADADPLAAFKSPIAPGFGARLAGLRDAFKAQEQYELKVAAMGRAAPGPVLSSRSLEASLGDGPVLLPARAIETLPLVATPKARRAASLPAAKRPLRSIKAPRAITAEEIIIAPVAALLTAVGSAFEPAKAKAVTPVTGARRLRAARKAAAKPRPIAIAAKKSPVKVAAKTWHKPRMTAARHHEIPAGFTTYAERRYHPQAKAAGTVRKTATVRTARKNAGAITVTPPASVKRASADKSGKSAGLKKSGGWKSSALEAPALRTQSPQQRGLTGRPLPLPPGSFEEHQPLPRRPGFPADPLTIG